MNSSTMDKCPADARPASTCYSLFPNTGIQNVNAGFWALQNPEDTNQSNNVYSMGEYSSVAFPPVLTDNWSTYDPSKVTLFGDPIFWGSKPSSEWNKWPCPEPNKTICPTINEVTEVTQMDLDYRYEKRLRCNLL